MEAIFMSASFSPSAAKIHIFPAFIKSKVPFPADFCHVASGRGQPVQALRSIFWRCRTLLTLQTAAAIYRRGESLSASIGAVSGRHDGRGNRAVAACARPHELENRQESNTPPQADGVWTGFDSLFAPRGGESNP